MQAYTPGGSPGDVIDTETARTQAGCPAEKLGTESLGKEGTTKPANRQHADSRFRVFSRG